MHSLKVSLKPRIIKDFVYASQRPNPLFTPYVNNFLTQVSVTSYSTAYIQLRFLASKKSKAIQFYECDTPTCNFGTKDVKQFLINQLQCSEDEASFIYSQNYDYLEKNVSKARQALDILLSFGIIKKTIRNNFWTVFFEKDQLEARLQLLRRWSFQDINNGVGIIKIPYGKLHKYTAFHEQDSTYLDGKNRITYFASYVRCEEKEACDLFMKYKFMLTIKVTYMKEILEILKEQQVDWGDVSRDPWVFRYSPEFLRRRVRRLGELGAYEKCDRVMPWMLRSTELTLDRYLKLRDENRAALGGHPDLYSLLASELGLPSEEEVAVMVARHPPLARLRSAKARDMARFLVASGFSGRTVAAVPRALCHKRDTLVARMAELKRFGPSVVSLQNLCRNKKDYNAFVKRLGGHGHQTPTDAN